MIEDDCGAPDSFARLTNIELTELLRDLAERVFTEGHTNHFVIEEAAARLESYQD